MYYFLKEKRVKKILVICTKALKRQWVKEINKFTDIPQRITTIYVEGTAKQRQKSYDMFNSKKFGVMVVNYHTIMNDVDVIKDMGFDMVVAELVGHVKPC